MTQAQPTKSIYTQQGLWYLFIMCAFPLHLWTLLLVFQDVSWVAQRTNAWDAIGVASYGMLFALIESILLFLVFAVIGLVIPRNWKAQKRIGFLILLVIALSVWGMIAQLLFLWNINLPWSTIHFLVNSGHPLRLLYAGTFAIVITTIALPILFFLTSEKAAEKLENLADQLSILTMFYFFLDVIGVIVIMVRNLN